MTLTQKQKLDIISYHTGSRLWPRNFSRQFYVSEKWYSKSELVQNFDEGTVVQVTFVQSTKYWSRIAGRGKFNLTYTDDINSWANLKNNHPSRRDYQRKKVYNFEDDIVLNRCQNYKISERSANLLLEYIYSCLGINPEKAPKICISKKNTFTSSSSSWEIKLSYHYGRYLYVVLHEIAHDIVRKLTKKEESVGHGKTFVATIMALYELFVPGWNTDYAKHQLAERKIKWSAMEYMAIKRAFLGYETLPIGSCYVTDRKEALLQYQKRLIECTD